MPILGVHLQIIRASWQCWIVGVALMLYLLQCHLLLWESHFHKGTVEAFHITLCTFEMEKKIFFRIIMTGEDLKDHQLTKYHHAH